MKRIGKAPRQNVVFANEARQAKFDEDRRHQRQQFDSVYYRSIRDNTKRAGSGHTPHQSYREAVRARTKPGSDDRHLGFEVAKLAAANGGTARKDFATFLDSLV